MSRLANLDRWLVATWLALSLYGLAVLYSSGQTDVETSGATAWQRQLIWTVLGVVAATVAFRFSPRLVEWVAPAIYVIAIALLVVTLLVGTGAGTAASSRSWISVAGVRVGQPAEFAKLAVVLMLARHLSGWRTPPESLVGFLPACLIAGVPFVLIALQPDLGSAMVLGGILFGMLFWAGARPAYLLLLASPILSLILAFNTGVWGLWIIALFATLLWLRPYLWEGLSVMLANVAMGVVALPFWDGLAPYQQNRLLAFLNPEIDPRAAGWHIIQSKIAIGSGGVIGQGFTAGPQKRLAFLPAQQTDFIFSVVGEELGFLGVSAALTMFAVLLFGLVRTAQRVSDAFASLVVFGVTGMLFTHIFENVGMTVSLMPITGIPLPFFSYGGSFMLVVWVGFGFILRASWDARRPGYDL